MEKFPISIFLLLGRLRENCQLHHVRAFRWDWLHWVERNWARWHWAGWVGCPTSIRQRRKFGDTGNWPFFWRWRALRWSGKLRGRRRFFGSRSSRGIGVWIRRDRRRSWSFFTAFTGGYARIHSSYWLDDAKRVCECNWKVEMEGNETVIMCDRARTRATTVVFSHIIIHVANVAAACFE